MDKLKKLLRGQQLTVMFALIIFLFMLFAMLLVFLGAFVLYRFGLLHTVRPVGVVLFLFALVSLLVGVALSMVFSRFPLAPLRELMVPPSRSSPPRRKPRRLKPLPRCPPNPNRSRRLILFWTPP